MPILLKIMLLMLSIGVIIIFRILSKDYIRVIKSEEYDSSSILSRLLMNIMAYASALLFISFIILSIILMTSKITIELAF
jgi:hypothetical protein